MHGRKFRRFMEERLSLADEDYPKTLATVRKHDDSPELPKGVAQVYWKRMHATADRWKTADKTIYLYELRLTQQRKKAMICPSPSKLDSRSLICRITRPAGMSNIFWPT
jgi:hypothetical protein